MPDTPSRCGLSLSDLHLVEERSSDGRFVLLVDRTWTDDEYVRRQQLDA